jgi:hypothetical protein
LKRDKGLKNIERPIDPDIMISVLNILKDTGRNVSPERITSTGNISSTIPPEKVASYVTDWNSIVDLVVNVDNIIKDPAYGYGDNVSQAYAAVTKNLRGIGFRLRSLRRLIAGELEAGQEKLIPKLKSIDPEKD